MNSCFQSPQWSPSRESKRPTAHEDALWVFSRSLSIWRYGSRVRRCRIFIAGLAFSNLINVCGIGTTQGMYIIGGLRTFRISCNKWGWPKRIQERNGNASSIKTKTVNVPTPDLFSINKIKLRLGHQDSSPSFPLSSYSRGGS